MRLYKEIWIVLLRRNQIKARRECFMTSHCRIIALCFTGKVIGQVLHQIFY